MVSQQWVSLEEQIDGWREGGVDVKGAAFSTFNLQGLTEGLAVGLMPSNPLHMRVCKSMPTGQPQSQDSLTCY